jgi:hypothetical protein
MGLGELTSFAQSGTPSPELQQFFDATEQDAATVQEYHPTQQLYFNGGKLASLGRQVNRLSTAGNTNGGSVTLEDWFIGLQASLAEQVCTCDAPSESPTNISALTISSDRLSEFLPSNAPVHNFEV